MNNDYPSRKCYTLDCDCNVGFDDFRGALKHFKECDCASRIYYKSRFEEKKVCWE